MPSKKPAPKKKPLSRCCRHCVFWLKAYDDQPPLCLSDGIASGPRIGMDVHVGALYFGKHTDGKFVCKACVRLDPTLWNARKAKLREQKKLGIKNEYMEAIK